jgi:hypothetical protein
MRTMAVSPDWLMRATLATVSPSSPVGPAASARHSVTASSRDCPSVDHEAGVL